MTAAAALDRSKLPRSLVRKLEEIERRHTASTDGSTDQIDPANAPPGAATEPNPSEAQPTDPTKTEPQLEQPRPADPATDPTESAAYWKQRFSVVQGMQREERRKADARESELNDRISILESELKALKASANPAPVDLKAVFTPEQIEALGEDQAAAIARASTTAARQHVDATLAERQAAEETRRQAQAQREQERRQEAFYDALDAEVPDWRTVDARQDWRQWLGEADPLTGQMRQGSLTAAVNSGDVATCAAMFEAFRKTLSRTAAPVPPVAAPRAAGAPAAPMPAQVGDRSQMPPSEAEIKDYYKRMSINRGRGVSAEERAEFEKRLQLL